MGISSTWWSQWSCDKVFGERNKMKTQESENKKNGERKEMYTVETVEGPGD